MYLRLVQKFYFVPRKYFDLSDFSKSQKTSRRIHFSSESFVLKRRQIFLIKAKFWVKLEFYRNHAFYKDSFKSFKVNIVDLAKESRLSDFRWWTSAKIWVTNIEFRGIFSNPKTSKKVFFSITMRHDIYRKVKRVLGAE